jgi:hypothetical protein
MWHFYCSQLSFFVKIEPKQTDPPVYYKAEAQIRKRKKVNLKGWWHKSCLCKYSETYTMMQDQLYNVLSFLFLDVLFWFWDYFLLLILWGNATNCKNLPYL